MREIEIFAKNIIDEGGEFYTLETSTKGKLAKTVSHYEIKHRVYNEICFQVFDASGKRVYVSKNYVSALAYYNNLLKEVQDGIV